MNVVISGVALDDIFHIGLSIKQDNPARAASFVDELYRSCREVGFMPHAFPLPHGHAVSGIRRRVHGNYLIFYRIGPEAVEILRVLHGAREYDQILFPEGG